jgi:hypothetical protein
MPPSRGGGSLTARFYWYGNAESDATVETVTVAASGTGVSASSTSYNDTPAWHGPLDIALTPPPEGADLPSLRIFKLSGDDTEIYSWCGWWRDATYG